MGQICVIINELRMNYGVGNEFSLLMMMMMISSLLLKHCTDKKWKEIKQLGSWTWEEKVEEMWKGHRVLPIVDYHLIMWWESGATGHVSHLRMM